MANHSYAVKASVISNHGPYPWTSLPGISVEAGPACPSFPWTLIMTGCDCPRWTLHVEAKSGFLPTMTLDSSELFTEPSHHSGFRLLPSIELYDAMVVPWVTRLPVSALDVMRSNLMWNTMDRSPCFRILSPLSASSYRPWITTCRKLKYPFWPCTGPRRTFGIWLLAWDKMQGWV